MKTCHYSTFPRFRTRQWYFHDGAVRVTVTLVWLKIVPTQQATSRPRSFIEASVACAAGTEMK
jgi:hypothetical protein